MRLLSGNLVIISNLNIKFYKSICSTLYFNINNKKKLKMEAKEKDYADQIEKTVTTIETHVEKKSATGLSTTIDKWIDVLEEHKDLKTVASNLKKLKKAIDDKDAEKIVELMATLGEETTKASEMAEGKEATKIKVLGKALTAGSKAISKFI